MKLNLDLPFKKLASDTQNNRALTIAIINSCVNTKFKDKPMNRSESRLWAGVQDIFDSGVEEIEIEKSVFLFIKDTVDNTDLPPMFSSWLWTVRDYLDSHKEDKIRLAIKE